MKTKPRSQALSHDKKVPFFLGGHLFSLRSYRLGSAGGGGGGVPLRNTSGLAFALSAFALEPSGI